MTMDRQPAVSTQNCAVFRQRRMVSADFRCRKVDRVESLGDVSLCLSQILNSEGYCVAVVRLKDMVKICLETLLRTWEVDRSRMSTTSATWWLGVLLLTRNQSTSLGCGTTRGLKMEDWWQVRLRRPDYEHDAGWIESQVPPLLRTAMLLKGGVWLATRRTQLCQKELYIHVFQRQS